MRIFKIIIIFLFLFTFENILLYAAKPINNDLTKRQVNSFFGINGGKAIHNPAELETTVKQRIEWMKELGVMWDRSDLWWHLIEPEKGKFDFSITDRIIKYYEENNIQIYPILCYGAKWWKEHNAPINDQDIDDFANYVYQTVKHYKDRFTYWSVWNEPNIAPFWVPNPDAEMYAKLLKKAYQAAKKADPDCIICAPVIAPLGSWDKKFTEKIYQLGSKEYFDVFDYHYYRNTPPEIEVPNEINEIKALMHYYNDEKPIWISETGVSSPIKEKPESYENQASLIVRNHLLCFAEGVEKIFYFYLQNWFDDEDRSWDSYLGLVEAKGEKKKSFSAYKTLINQIDQKEIIGRCTNFDEYIKAVLIYDSKTDECTLAIWNSNENDSAKVKIFTDENDINITDIYGDKTKVLKSELLYKDKVPYLEIKIDKFPKYIKGVNKTFYFSDAGIKPEYKIIKMTPGEEKYLKIETDKRLSVRQLSSIKTIIPKGLSWDTKTWIIKADENISPELKEIQCSIEYKTDNKYFPVIKKEISLNAEIIPVFSLNLRPYIDSEIIHIDGTLNNFSSKERQYSLKIEEIIQSKSNILALKEDIRIKPNQIQHLDFIIDKKILLDYTNPVDWYMSYGSYKSKPFKIAVVKFTDKEPIIDGEIDEWEKVPPISINKSEMITRGKEGWTEKNASADIKMQFSKDKVFFAGRVYDNDPVINKNKAVEIWKGDSFELYLGFSGPAKRTVINKKYEFQIGLAPTYEGNKSIVFLYHEDKILENSEIKTKKLKDGYILEAFIILSDLGGPKIEKGMLLGFDTALNDIDSGDWAPADNLPGRALMFGGNNMNWIDPSGWSMAVIAP